MKYRVGDKVWIRNDIDLNQRFDNGNIYRVRMGETDIRGTLVEITKDQGSYDCIGYESFYDCMINHTKTEYEVNKYTYTHSSQIPNQEPNYEIY